MKKTLIFISVALFLFACGGGEEASIEDILSSGSIKELRAKRDEVAKEQKVYVDQLALLDEKIAALDSTKKIPLVTSMVVNETTFNHYIELQGNVSTRDHLVLYPEFSGILVKILVREGAQVKEGQTLAKIDDGGLSQQLSQLQIQADLAKTTFERQERLWKQNIGSEIQYLQSKTMYESQAKAVKQLQEQIAKTIVKAPFSGIIDEVITEQGSFVSPGASPLMRIVNLKNMYIETNVPESHISNIAKDKDVEVQFPVLGKKVVSKVAQVGNYINPANRTFKIEVPVTNADKLIKPNLTAKLRINDYTNEKALLIPQSIISENAEGEQYIYVVKDKRGDNGIAKRVVIQTGKTEGDVIEILGGVKNGAEIIKEGARSIEDGQEIKIKNLSKNGK